MPLNQQTIDTLRATVDAACFDHRIGLPGATVVVVGKDGTELFAHSAGRRGVASLEDMTLDNAFWIASCTKAVTGIAVSIVIPHTAERLLGRISSLTGLGLRLCAVLILLTSVCNS